MFEERQAQSFLGLGERREKFHIAGTARVVGTQERKKPQFPFEQAQPPPAGTTPPSHLEGQPLASPDLLPA